MKTTATNPIHITGIDATSGKPLLGGIFQMQDRMGFPLDSCFEEAKMRGYRIDWLEALCDCWLNDCLKFDSFVRQASDVTGADLRTMFTLICCGVGDKFPKIKKTTNPVDVCCRYILRKKRYDKIISTMET